MHRTRREHELGAVFAFRPRAVVLEDDQDRTGLPTIEPTLADRVATAGRSLGLRHTAPERVSIPDRLTDAPADVWHLVIADAFHLPWVPYYQHKHAGHSFVVRTTEGSVELLDAYTNDTPWGAARPSVWTLTPAALRATLDHVDSFTVVGLTRSSAGMPIGPAEALASTVRELTSATDDGRIDSYLDAYARHPDHAAALSRLTTEVWLMARQRMAQARWLATADAASGTDDRPAYKGADQWLEAAEATYLAMRRAQRSRPVPGGVLDRIAHLLRTDSRRLKACLQETPAVVR
ncbi:hypothetical protein K2224_14150 [Streptomyces sp. BHT-5-2]|uniref:hypothetical protein n=1 Tax=Streptomyces sp. BHT-5-2 TaxID=2866715 RepID=UPI001C8DAF71|nr:hypothetical protein [Streptomyces sp. BHT-5-2]QZL04200.1 hypothetical protein K2224_14150 [Streptomyces sp. BHT-5-2]